MTNTENAVILVELAPADDPVIARINLDMLAYDIADMMDRNEHGGGEIADIHLRPHLESFLRAALATARADTEN
jgi:hypothetical protein